MIEESLQSINHLMVSSKTLEAQKTAGYPGLPDQKKLFAHLYVQDFNHRAAAQKSGFSPDSGMRLLREPLLAHYISYIKSEVFARLQVDAELVKSMWLETIPVLAGEKEANRLMKDGSVVKAKNFDGPSLVSALRELNKMTDVYSDTSKSGGISVQINLGSLGVTEEVARGVTIEGTFTSSEDDDGAPV